MNLGIVSTYPPEDEKYGSGSGVSGYTKNLAEHLGQKVDELAVFSNNESYAKENYRVKNSWDEDFLYPLSLILSIYRSDEKFDLIHIQHEMFLYGGLVSASFFPLLLLALRVGRIKRIVTLHNGLISKDDLDEGFCKRHCLPKIPLILKRGLHLYFKAITSLSPVIVHENKFKEILIEDYGVKPERISVIPHGVSQVSAESSQDWDNNTVLFFGHIAPYKGVERLFEIQEELQIEHELIIAGGKHPGAEKENYYSQYYEKIKKKSSISEDVCFTGFIEEEDIETYFNRADLVILPYVDLFASSGPLHHAISFEKPVLTSEEFEGVIEDEMIYSSTTDAAKKASDTLQEDKRNIQKLSTEIKSERSWNKVSQTHVRTYEELID